MTVLNPPGFLQNAGATHTAEQFRNWHDVLVAGKISATSLIARGGVNPALGNTLSVTQTGSPSMAVIVKSGHAIVPGSEGTKQGIYSVMNDADVTLSISAAHATLNRIDSVVFKVEDSQYSGVANTSSLVIVTGTPASSPAAPVLPNNCIELARVSIVALDTSITNGEITDRRYYLAATGGKIQCTSATRPAANTIVSGQEIYETDTFRTMITHDAGTTWVNKQEKYISRTTVAVLAASVVFTLPTNLRSILITYRGRSNAGAANNVNVTINGSGAAVYTFYNCGSTDGADITPAGGGAQVNGFAGVIPGGGTRFSAGEITFPSWDITTSLTWKFESYAYDGTNQYARYGGGNYDAAGPYTSITLAPAVGSWVVGSDFILEGTYT